MPDKMKKINLFIIIIFLVPFTVLSGNSGSVSHKVNVSIPKVALVNIAHSSVTNGSSSIHTPIFQNGKSEGHWINYSSIINGDNCFRSVMVAVSGALPEGIYVLAEATSYQGKGNGKTGIPLEKVRLSENPQPLITDIGSCYTGTGPDNGHMISYEIVTNNSEMVHNINDIIQDIRVVYTLTD